ncbi:enoyl-CoA hydratase/isomerase family protein [Roseateles sp.]|jgi:enoyl-CoA hydratase/carnithine racemase|uniref:enoyl-CoA hydratase/isomerase family protein n=1 Tax=Roseateles sp. TaxID=1971397 RepID=UPI0037C5D82A
MPEFAPSLDIEGSVARITLQRPRHANRLEPEDLELLLRHLATVEQAAEVRVLLLQARGKHFCSGFNIRAVPGLDAGALFEKLSNAWAEARPVTVAAIQGGVYGGATDLALACDFRLGTHACEMFVPAARLGLHFYRGGLERYVSRLGLSAAKRVLLGCETLDAQAMLACGFLDRLLPDAQTLAQESQSLCEQLSLLAPLALLGMKKHLNAIAEGKLDAEALRADIVRANASDDLAEGVRAWEERRPPRFVGR